MTEKELGFVAGKVIQSRNMMKEFIVEFLGSLVPGVAFFLALVPAFFIPLLVSVCGSTYVASCASVFSTAGVPTSFGTVLFVMVPAVLGFLSFAYIAGHLFYRQDPKIADQASFKRLPRHIHNDGMVRPLQGGNAPVEFPYHFLKQYLLDRGIDYLARRIPWESSDQTTFKRRAKHFANALKIRIQIEAPAVYSILSRNEAHVRLSSSMWYVSWSLLIASLCGIVMLIVRVIIMREMNTVVLLPAITGLFALLCKWGIERALHYQREREILFILETAHWLELTGKAVRVFDDLSPRLAGKSDEHL